MALPAHLARYDGIIDLVVEELVRAVATGADSPPLADIDRKRKAVRGVSESEGVKPLDTPRAQDEPF